MYGVYFGGRNGLTHLQALLEHVRKHKHLQASFCCLMNAGHPKVVERSTVSVLRFELHWTSGKEKISEKD